MWLHRRMPLTDAAAHGERTSRNQRPVRRTVRTAPRWYQLWFAFTVLVGIVGLFVSGVFGVGFAFAWAAVWLLWILVLLVRARRRALRPADPGVQIYEDLNLPAQPKLPPGVPSSQLFVPCGLALGWFVRRGLVSDWFHEQSGDALAAFEAGRKTGPQLYALWHGILASDMLNDEGRAFARRYLWGFEPYGVPQPGKTPYLKGVTLWPRAKHQWFLRDLEALRGERSSVYLIDDDEQTAEAFGRLADRRLARWRRWLPAYAFWEAERSSVRPDGLHFPDVPCTWQYGHATWQDLTI
jgi:hypothetical protein